MIFASATTTELDPNAATKALAQDIRAQMSDANPDFALVFLSPHYARAASYIGEALRAALTPRVLIGCTGEGVIGREREIENEPAIVLIVAHLPNVTLAPFALQTDDWESLLNERAQFQNALNAPGDAKLFVMVADPFTTPMDQVLAAFNSQYAGIPIIGGMASGAPQAGSNALVFNDHVYTSGAVGVAFAGEFEVDVIVSQAAHPIGRPFTVTRAERNIIFELEGETPLARVQKLYGELSEDERTLVREGLYLGRAINPRTERGTSANENGLGRGDFLIRGVMGGDPRNGALAVGDFIHDGEIVQFHVRDQTTAEEDLEMMLTPQVLFDPPRGALLFSCNGRGTRLYDHPNGDIATIQKILGAVNLAGFFCAGEIGPIGGKNFLHGQTASLVLFRPPSPQPLPGETGEGL